MSSFPQISESANELRQQYLNLCPNKFLIKPFEYIEKDQFTKLALKLFSSKTKYFINPHMISAKYNTTSTQHIEETLDSLVEKGLLCSTLVKDLPADLGLILFSDEKLYFAKDSNPRDHLAQMEVTFNYLDFAYEVLSNYSLPVIVSVYRELQNLGYQDCLPKRDVMDHSKTGLVLRLLNFFNNNDGSEECMLGENTFNMILFFDKYFNFQKKSLQEQQSSAIEKMNNESCEVTENTASEWIKLYKNLHDYELSEEAVDFMAQASHYAKNKPSKISIDMIELFNLLDV